MRAIDDPLSLSCSISVAASNIEGGQGPNTTIQATTGLITSFFRQSYDSHILGDTVPVDSDITISVSYITALQAVVSWSLLSSNNKELHLQYRQQGNYCIYKLRV